MKKHKCTASEFKNAANSKKNNHKFTLFASNWDIQTSSSTEFETTRLL